MGSRRAKLKGRREGGTFGAWPHECGRHENYARLTLNARALLLELIGQFNSFNNGDLTVAYTVLALRGWRSRTTVDKACQELEQSGWIVRTRQGGKNRCNLYAVTYAGINDCKGKLDVPSSPVALGFWKLGQNPWYERDKAMRPKGSGVCSKPKARARGAHDVVKSPEITQSHAALAPTIWASPLPETPRACPAHGHLKELPSGQA